MSKKSRTSNQTPAEASAPSRPSPRLSDDGPKRSSNQIRVKRRALGVFDSLDDFIPYKLSVVANRVSQSIGRLFDEKYGLQIPEWRILMTLYECGNLVFNEVVERTSMDKARVSRAQKRLVDLKMITASSDPSDGRRIILNLTELGTQRCADILPDAAEREAWFLCALDNEEQRQLNTILDKLMARSKDLMNPPTH